MTQEIIPMILDPNRETLADRVRKIADQLKQETALQITATSRILGAAAQISENHDRLIDEVVDMVEEDLDQATLAYCPAIHTVDSLKQQFKTLNDAKSYFGLKANSWSVLVDKLKGASTQKEPPTARNQIPQLCQENEKSNSPLLLGERLGVRADDPSDLHSKRLDGIEIELKRMRRDINQILMILKRAFPG
jgi:hypothetical protein